MTGLPPGAELRRRLASRRSSARRVLWIERIWPRLWPALLLVGVFLAAALFDLPSMLATIWHLVLLAAVAGGLGYLLWRGLRPLHAPTEAEIDRRLERASGLRHRPLVVLDDRPTTNDAAATALWRAHSDRATAQLARLRVGWPRPSLPRPELRAGRAALLVVLLVGLAVAGADAPDRLGRALWPRLVFGPPEPAPLLQAWVTPPGYTGLAPVFLKADVPDVAVPAGSHLTVSLTGGRGEPALSYGADKQAFATLDPTSWQAERDLTGDGALVIQRRGSTVGQWQVTTIPDEPPTVAWASPPGPSAATRRLQTRLPYTAADDYGLVKLQVEMRLQLRPGAPPLVINLPLPGGAAKEAKGVATQDLTANPWAGLAVTAHLVATDAPGQHGSSADAVFTLPERPFKNPLARAVIDIRRRLSVAPENHDQAAADLQALAEAPEAFDNNTGIFLALSSTATLLTRQGEPAVPEAQARLWSLALQLETDAVARTAQAVAQAREALQQSVQRGDRSDMDKKADALRQEIQRHLQALAEKARRDGTLMPFDPTARTLNQRDFDKLTQEMKDAAKAGRTQEAQEKLQQLERMLDQLKQAEANPSGDRKQAQQQRQRGRQQMGAAEDMVQRETGMKGRATDRTAKDDPAARDSDARQQRALRRALGEMMQQFGDLTGKVPDGLSDADIAMRDAGTALGSGDNAKAATDHQRAIDALQKGEQQMSQQMASALGISVQPGEGEGQGQGMGPGEGDGDQTAEGDENGNGQSGDQTADADGQAGQDPSIPRDPLGRPTRDGTSGRSDSGDVHVPDQMEQARTRDIQNELRRREGQRTRPAGELDYIDRLLKSY